VPNLTDRRFRPISSQAVVPINYSPESTPGREVPPRSSASPTKAATHSQDNQSGLESFSDKTGILPRSILGTVSRIAKELSPEAETELVRDFRSSKRETILALRFVLLLMLIPLLTQQLTKNFVVGPIVDYVRRDTISEVFINREMEEEALHELQLFKEQLEFENLLKAAPKISADEMEQRLQEKAAELATVYTIRSRDAIKNVFADLFGLIAFAIVITNNRRSIAVFQSFFSRIVYGLSDSAKAFILILLTDVFVGFHSPHGWEVLLEGACRHLGLPANREFIFIFIATFPVILDTIFKYWIFRYLNRISPSAVATYRTMNE
ncbi:MAG: proton extrusion protein PcxA, partial [Cyanobacteriota bacterium SKYGB_h_bin112]|nr:proton extrusion protein PcxA [Cyanobacteriota bacterium SKYGB_h_bin112]